MIRQANLEDVSRIAEILIFTKRMTYRPIFQDDPVSFGEMQVVSLAEKYIAHPEQLNKIWVWEDIFVKGLITLHDYKDERALQVEELYVEPFFHGEGIGSGLLTFADKKAVEMGADTLFLWVLEKNEKARHFYEKHGYVQTKERKLEEGTPEFIVKYQKNMMREL